MMKVLLAVFCTFFVTKIGSASEYPLSLDLLYQGRIETFRMRFEPYTGSHDHGGFVFCLGKDEGVSENWKCGRVTRFEASLKDRNKGDLRNSSVEYVGSITSKYNGDYLSVHFTLPPRYRFDPKTKIECKYYKGRGSETTTLRITDCWMGQGSDLLISELYKKSRVSK